MDYINRLSMQNVLKLWQTLTTPRSMEVEAARQEYMTKAVSLIAGVVAGALTLLFAVGWGFDILPLDSLVITLGMSLVFSGGWWLSDRGHWRIAGYFPPVLILAAAMYGNRIGGIGAPAMALYALAIALSATLQSTCAHCITLIISVGAYVGIGSALMTGHLVQIRFPETAFANRIIIVTGVYITLSGLLWFLVAEFRRIVTQAHAYAEQLAVTNRALAQEIEEHKQAQEALTEKHSLLQMLIDSTPDHIYVKDLDHRFLIVNKGILRELGATSLTELEGKTDRDFHPPERERQYHEEERIVMTAGQILINREDSLIDEVSGERRWYLTTKAPLRDKQGHIIGLVGFNRDITDRKRAEEKIHALNAELEQRVRQRTAELEAANKELQSFAYVVSHDLKAPLRNMTQLLNWLVSDYADAFDAQGREYMDLLLNRAKQMNNLIQAVLQYSRVGRSKLEEPIDVPLLLREVCETLAPPPTVRIGVGSELPALWGDRIRIQQVFQNLIGNAIKFLDKPEGEITIDCADCGAYWQFSVTDNGPGIDPQHHEKIFQIFQTLRQRDDMENTGIGLAIVKKIVESSGGRIWVESAVGTGSAFHFTLPKRAISEEDA